MRGMALPTPPPDGRTAERASHHAREASRVLLTAAVLTDVDDQAALAELANAHALTSLAWTALNPPGRRAHRHTLPVTRRECLPGTCGACDRGRELGVTVPLGGAS